jgi:hypothetical protein
MNIPTVTIKGFEDIIKIGTTLGKNWYRGHSKVFGNMQKELSPKQAKWAHDLYTQAKNEGFEE